MSRIRTINMNTRLRVRANTELPDKKDPTKTKMNIPVIHLYVDDNRELMIVVFVDRIDVMIIDEHKKKIVLENNDGDVLYK